jgi:hypothetical protein
VIQHPAQDTAEPRGAAGYNPRRQLGRLPRRGHPVETGIIVATKRQVERKLRELIKRLDDADGEVRGSLAGALPDSRIVEVIVPDLGVSYWTELAGGTMGELHEGVPPDPEIRIHVPSDVLIELVDGDRSLFSAYLSGQVKIDASFGDLLRLRKLA